MHPFRQLQRVGDLMLEVKAERHSGGSRRVRVIRPGGST
jgi:hypothetical protein